MLDMRGKVNIMHLKDFPTAAAFRTDLWSAEYANALQRLSHKDNHN